MTPRVPALLQKVAKKEGYPVQRGRLLSCKNPDDLISRDPLRGLKLFPFITRSISYDPKVMGMQTQFV